MEKFWKYENIPNTLWNNWKWQLKNRLQNGSNLKEYFPNISRTDLNHFLNYTKMFNIGITPYTLSLIGLDKYLNPKDKDPIWDQFKFHSLNENFKKNDYDGIKTNWELPKEMPTTILHHKYSDRAIIRITNNCMGYCSYCYLTKRVLDINAKRNLKRDKQIWKKTLAYLKSHPEIRDIIVSGGDPLLLNNDQIENVLSDLSEISSIKTIRLNTRVLSFNPFRINKDLLNIFKRYRVNILEIQVVHPAEITDVFDDTIKMLNDYGNCPIILWRAPLLKGINDSFEVLEDLLMKLYTRKIMPYYIFHCTPFSLGRSIYGTSIKNGIELLSRLRRRIPGPAFPRYTLFHISGKQDIPLELKGTPNFQFCKYSGGDTIVRFKNWKKQWVSYPDI